MKLIQFFWSLVVVCFEHCGFQADFSISLFQNFVLATKYFRTRLNSLGIFLEQTVIINIIGRILILSLVMLSMTLLKEMKCVIIVDNNIKAGMN